MSKIFIEAANEIDVLDFMRMIFPKEWHPVASRIYESGVEFGTKDTLWAPRWSKIPWTVKTGRTELEASLKSCLYRVHDCLHQLWGLPIPTKNFTIDEYYLFKRAQMCGEVAVLTLSELILCSKLYQEYPTIRPMLERRCGVQMLMPGGPLHDKSSVELAMRMDDILHKNSKPRWVREDPNATKFWEYYVPMLEADREGVDNNWKAMVNAQWVPSNLPNSRYSPNLDGLELTIWMINDFYHLLKTDSDIDWGLRAFNRQRRQSLLLPPGWK